jgi:hypothetical protein
MRVRKSGCEGDLLEKEVSAQRFGDLGADGLESDLSVVFVVLSSVDRTHSPLTDLLENLVVRQ